MQDALEDGQQQHATYGRWAKDRPARKSGENAKAVSVTTSRKNREGAA